MLVFLGHQEDQTPGIRNEYRAQNVEYVQAGRCIDRETGGLPMIGLAE